MTATSTSPVDVSAIEAELTAALGAVPSPLQARQIRRAAELLTLSARARGAALSGDGFDIQETMRLESLADEALAVLQLPASPVLSKLEIELVNPRALKALSDTELDTLHAVLEKMQAAAVAEGEPIPEPSPAMKEAHAAVQEIAEHYRHARDDADRYRTEAEHWQREFSRVCHEREADRVAGAPGRGAGSDGAAAALPAPEATGAVPETATGSTADVPASNVVPIGETLAERKARNEAAMGARTASTLPNYPLDPMATDDPYGRGAGRFDNKILGP